MRGPLTKQESLQRAFFFYSLAIAREKFSVKNAVRFSHVNYFPFFKKRKFWRTLYCIRIVLKFFFVSFIPYLRVSLPVLIFLALRGFFKRPNARFQSHMTNIYLFLKELNCDCVYIGRWSDKMKSFDVM